MTGAFVFSWPFAVGLPIPVRQHKVAAAIPFRGVRFRVDVRTLKYTEPQFPEPVQGGFFDDRFGEPLVHVGTISSNAARST